MRKLQSAAPVVLALLGAMMASGCGYSEDEYRAKTREIERLQGELETANRDRAALNRRLTAISDQNEAMATRLRAMGEDVSSLSTNLEASQRREADLRRRQQQAEERLATFREMLQRFQAMIASGQLRVRIVRGRMVVELAENILFDSGRSELKREGQAALTQVGEVLKGIEHRDFQVAGHTDNIPVHGRFPSNWELSTARAVTVARFLQQGGVDAAHLSAAGYAEFQPAADNGTAEGRQQNRRIEIVLMPNLDELPDLSSLVSESPSTGGSH
jgi:chemotaxis protein MotB